MKITVSYEEVAEVASNCVRNGDWPTANSVRNILGKGSYSTVQTFLASWQKNFLERKSRESTIPEAALESFYSLYVDIENKIEKRYEKERRHLLDKIAILERDVDILKQMLRESRLSQEDDA